MKLIELHEEYSKKQQLVPPKVMEAATKMYANGWNIKKECFEVYSNFNRFAAEILRDVLKSIK